MCQPIQFVHIETHSGADRKVVVALIILAHKLSFSFSHRATDINHPGIAIVGGQ